MSTSKVVRSAVRNFQVLVEFPVRKTDTNAKIIENLDKLPYAKYSGVVFSDKAAGLDHFCDVETLLDRKLVAEVSEKLKHNNKSIWNVVRTGDRCESQLLNIDEQLYKQGSSAMILVSGHDYRIKLRFLNENGSKCERKCSNKHSGERSLLCGKESSSVFGSDAIRKFRLKLGAAIHGNEENLHSKRNASFLVTQACPLWNTEIWLTKVIQLSPPIPLFVSIIPVLSYKELDRFKALGSTGIGIGSELDGCSEALLRQKGMEAAIHLCRTLSQRDDINGIYLYHHKLSVVKEILHAF